jgi:hypothetical protein
MIQEIIQNGPEDSGIFFKIFQNFPECSEIIRNVPECPKIFQNNLEGK